MIAMERKRSLAAASSLVSAERGSSAAEAFAHVFRKGLPCAPSDVSPCREEGDVTLCGLAIGGGCGMGSVPGSQASVLMVDFAAPADLVVFPFPRSQLHLSSGVLSSPALVW